jgi:MoaA/NifB/PqqE/SkfB family radical SAM enzyme
MRRTVVERLLEQYPTIGAFALAGQGEPCLAPEFPDIVRMLAQAGKRVILDTNGVHSSPLHGLEGCFTRISLSLYGHDDRSYEAYTGVPAFKTVMDSYRRFQDTCESVCITYIVDKYDMATLERILELCDRLRPSRLLLYNPICYDLADTAQVAKIMTVRDTEITCRIDEMISGRAYPIDPPLYPDFDKPLNSCRSYCQIVNIDGNGDIGGCLRQRIPDNALGNVFRDEDCFNTPPLLRLRRLQMTGRRPHAECAICFGNWGYGDCNALSWRRALAHGGRASPSTA